MIRMDIDNKLKVKKIDDLIDLPLVVCVNKFEEASATTFRNQFNSALNTGQKVIPVVIDSFGGQVYSLLSMVATIKQSPVPVATIISGKAMSCGAVLFSCGTEGMRFMDPYATVLIHEVSGGALGKVEEIKADAKEIERLNILLYKIMANNVGKADDYFLKLTHDKNHADVFMTADECKSHNLANHIRIPSFKVKITTDVSFE